MALGFWTLDFQTFDFHTTLTFVHYKFSPQPIFCTPNLDFCTQMTKKHFELSLSGAIKLSPKLYFVSTKCKKSQYQWLCGLKGGSAATYLLRLWVQILPGSCMSLCCECCVWSGRGLCDGPITHPEESY